VAKQINKYNVTIIDYLLWVYPETSCYGSGNQF